MSTSDKRDAGASSDRQPDDPVDQSRRDALKVIGRFGAYTAPGMIAMMTGQAYAQGSNR